MAGLSLKNYMHGTNHHILAALEMSLSGKTFFQVSLFFHHVISSYKSTNCFDEN